MPRPRKTSITPLSADERETIILMDDGSDVAKISTHQKAIYTKLQNNPAATLVEDLTHGSSVGAAFEIPAEFISFRSKKSSRKVSDEERAKKRAYAAKAVKARRNQAK